MQEALIDKIYECAFVPEGWPDVLDSLAEISDARGGLVCVANSSVMSWTTSPALQESFEEYVTQGWQRRGGLRERLFSNMHAGFVRECDLFSPDELEKDEVYRDYMLPRGLGPTAGFAVPSPTGDMIALTIQRDSARGSVEPDILQKLDALRPHLARSMLTSARLQFQRAEMASEALALIGLPALVFDVQGKTLAANALMESLKKHLSWRAFDRAALRDPLADRLWRQAIETIASDAAPRSFPVRAAEGPAMVAHVVPVRGVARDVLVRCAGVLILTSVVLPQAPPVELVRSLFDLTPAEARVARHLASGRSVGEIAAEAELAESTVRSQIRGVMEKTGCRRQLEVATLLGGVGKFNFKRARSDEPDSV